MHGNIETFEPEKSTVFSKNLSETSGVLIFFSKLQEYTVTFHYVDYE